jgi:hypothetical protein
MGRALLGLLKGLVVGGGIAYGLLYLGGLGGLGQADGLFTYLACAVTGALVGLICGRAPWRAETIWTPVLKMLFGLAVGAGLCALGRHVLPEWTLPTGMTAKLNLLGLPGNLSLTTRSGALLAPAIGVLYGLFVEVDDGGSSDKEKDKKKAKGG